MHDCSYFYFKSMLNTYKHIPSVYLLLCVCACVCACVCVCVCVCVYYIICIHDTGVSFDQYYWN